jgi:hypothetical protein
MVVRRSPPEPPHEYVVGWRCAGLVLMGAGWLTAPLVVRPVAVLGLCLLGIFVSFILFVLMDANGRAGSPSRGPSLGHAVAGAGIAVASAVAVQALGLVGWCLLAGVLLTSPAVVSRSIGLCRTAAATPSAPYRSQAAQLSTPALLQAWRASLLSLARARTATAKAAVVARRRAYLDELESRDPEGVRRWLDSGAGPGGDPSRYLTRRPDEPA